MFVPDLTPLINQIKEFNTNQLRTNQLLTEILLEIRGIKNEVQQLQSNIVINN